LKNLIFFTIALVIIAATSYFSVKNSVWLSLNGTKTLGVVFDHKTYKKNPGPSATDCTTSLVEYNDKNKNNHVFKTITCQYYAIGTKSHVLYDPNYPDKTRIDSFDDLWKMALIRIWCFICYSIDCFIKPCFVKI